MWYCTYMFICMCIRSIVCIYVYMWYCMYMYIYICGINQLKFTLNLETATTSGGIQKRTKNPRTILYDISASSCLTLVCYSAVILRLLFLFLVLVFFRFRSSLSRLRHYTYTSHHVSHRIHSTSTFHVTNLSHFTFL